MRQNKGFTLFELLAVVVIIAVIAGFVGVAATTSGSSSAKKSIQMIDSYISELRLNCMSRAGKPYSKLFIKDGVLVAEYYEDETLLSEETLSDSRVSVSYKASTEAVTALGDANSPLKISFARSTGALKEPALTENPKELKLFVSGGTKNYTLSIVAVTGSHEIE